MNTLLVIIANYGKGQLKYLNKMLYSFNNFKKYNVSIILLTTEYVKVNKFKNLHIKQVKYDYNIGKKLPLDNIKFLLKNKNLYNLYLYTENDIYIKESHIDYFIKYSEEFLNTKFIPGFIRFEKNDNLISLPDMTPNHSINRILFLKILWKFFPSLFYNIEKIFYKKLIIHKFYHNIYYEPMNIHQGFYLINNYYLNKIIKNNKINVKNYCSSLESAASFPYFKNGLIKVCPINNNDYFVHHMSNKYVNNKNNIYKKEFFEILNKY